MPKAKDTDLFKAIKTYITVYLPVIRRKSNNTVEAARYGLNLFFDYLSDAKNLGMRDVTASDFSAENITGFLSWLQTVRQNEVTSVNQRLSQIRSFCKYLMKNDILYADEMNRIADIAMLKDTRKDNFEYLSADEVKNLLNLPDKNTKIGIRDCFYMALLYDSGARDQELLDLCVRDFVLKNADSIELHINGKGNKYRATPISNELRPIYQRYMSVYHSDESAFSDEPLFYTIRKGLKCKMSADNVQRFLNKYEQEAKTYLPDIIHLHPHLFRRTRAMHLYTAGVPLPLVSEWLGHTNLETTQIYAKATMEMKRKAAEKLNDNPSGVFKNDVSFKYANDTEALRKLCGLK